MVAPYWVFGIQKPRLISLEEFEKYLKKRRIEVIPFNAPPLVREKDRKIYERLKEVIDYYLEPDEEIITLCRAILQLKIHQYLIVFTDKRTMFLEIKRKSVEVVHFESIPMIKIENIAVLFGRKHVPIRTPLVDFNSLEIHIKLKSGDNLKYHIADITGSVAGLTGG